MSFRTSKIVRLIICERRPLSLDEHGTSAIAEPRHRAQTIADIAKPLGIAVRDHIIVGKDGHASLKGLKLI
jgi:hypothetical protein